MGLVFVDDPVVDPETWESWTRRDPFEGVVARGVADGSLDAAVPADWVVVQCWAVLFGASLALRLDPSASQQVVAELAAPRCSGVSPPADLAPPDAASAELGHRHGHEHLRRAAGVGPA